MVLFVCFNPRLVIFIYFIFGSAGSVVWHTGLVDPQNVNLPPPGMEPTSTTLEGGFLTALSPGKS